MRERIQLTEKNLKTIKPEDVIAITIATGGAMGDPGAIEIVDKDLKVYITHLSEIDTSKLEGVIPFINTLQVMFDDIAGAGDDWAGLYTGYGNYLFVRPELKEPILHFVEEKYGNTNLPLVVELYSHWYDALTSIR